MSINTNQAEIKSSSHCSKTFDTSNGQIKNSYLCNQRRFTSADSWNVLKQKKYFAGK
jgi:hypothetical protein